MGTRLTDTQRANIAEWVRRLRSTDRNPGRGALHAEVVGCHRYCPLGVAVEYAAEQRVVESVQHAMPIQTDTDATLQTIIHSYDGSIATMTAKVRNWYGIDVMTVNRLIHMNDRANVSFREIANFLEQEFLSDHDRDSRTTPSYHTQGYGPGAP